MLELEFPLRLKNVLAVPRHKRLRWNPCELIILNFL